MSGNIFENLMAEQDAAATPSPEDVLAALKAQADLLGVQYAGNIGAETLSARIDEHLKALDDTQEAASVNTTAELSKAIEPVNEAPEPAPVVAKKPRADVELSTTSGNTGGAVSGRVDTSRPMSLREWKLRDSLRLVRVIVHNMDPNDKDLEGQIFTVANEYIGTVSKLVPFGDKCGVHGYHVPHCIYKQLKAAKMLQIRVMIKDGKEDVQQKWIRKFNIEVLPTISEHELAKLKASQLATQAID